MCTCLALSGHTLLEPAAMLSGSPTQPTSEVTCVVTNKPAERQRQLPIVGVKMTNNGSNLQVPIRLRLLAAAQRLENRDKPCPNSDPQNHEYNKAVVYCRYVLESTYYSATAATANTTTVVPRRTFVEHCEELLESEMEGALFWTRDS